MKEHTPYVWRQSDGQGGKVETPMNEMTPEQLQERFEFACNKEFEGQMKVNAFNQLANELREVAERKGIRLLFPDEQLPIQSFMRVRYGNYFKNSRRLLEVPDLELVAVKHNND